MSQIQTRFDLEISRLRLEQQTEENKATLLQAKHDLREAKVAETEYPGSFKSFRDRLRGRQEAAETALRHAVQQAETALSAAQRQKEVLDARLTEVTGQLSALPDWEALRDGSREWYRLDALLSMEKLLPLLEVCLELLTQRRNQFNGTNAGQLKTRQDLADIYSAPEAAGEDCKVILLGLQSALDALEIPFQLPSFFEAPTAFLSSATQYTRMDRVNTAMDQAQVLLNRLPSLQKQLSE